MTFQWCGEKGDAAPAGVGAASRYTITDACVAIDQLTARIAALKAQSEALMESRELLRERVTELEGENRGLAQELAAARAQRDDVEWRKS